MRKVDQEIEYGIFDLIDGIDSPLCDGHLLARVEYWYDEEAEQNLRLAAAC